MPTGALYGFAQMLLKLVRDEKPDFAAVCFDTPEPTFRDEMYKEYKANRKEPPDELVAQFPYVNSIVDALGLATLEKSGFEADDIIGTLAKKFSGEGYEVVIVSGDKDLMQLVGKNISILDEMKDKRIGVDGVIEKFGVGPDKVVEILGLAGDSSDNIPGVPGVGPKTALTLIEKYDTIENLIAHADELRGAVAEKIKANARLARLSRKLVEIDTNVKIDVKITDLNLRGVDKEKTQTLFTELEFSKLLSSLLPNKSLSSENYKLISTEKSLNEVISLIKKSQVVAINLETTSPNPMDAEIAGIYLSWARGEAAHVPAEHVKFLHPIFSDVFTKKIGHDLNYAQRVLRRSCFDLNGILFDTMLASYVIDPGENNDLATLSQKYLNHKLDETNFSENADAIFCLSEIFESRIKEDGLTELFYDMEMKLLPVLVNMELIGVKVDKSKLEILSVDFEKRLSSLEKEIFKHADGEFNINSPKQLGEILFGKLKLPGAKKTKTGFSTSQDILEGLALRHELPRLILDYRSLSKLKSTYIDSLPELIDKNTARIHTSFNQAVTATGRLSSSDPNLQNIPIRSEEGRKIREAFVAEDGFVLLSADYSQIELRILAHMSRDEVLIEAFKRNDDIHSITASGIFGVSPNDVTREQRAVGKTVNFATIYGQTPFGLSKQLRIEVADAIRYIENYFKKYPRVARYRAEIISRARKEGMVVTLFGRRRFFPDLMAGGNQSLQQLSERMAFNTVFQGTAADIIKRAMIAIYDGLPQVSKKTKMILQVHDELLFEVPEADLEKVKKYIIEEMEGAAKLDVPMTVDVGIGKNWAEAY